MPRRIHLRTYLLAASLVVMSACSTNRHAEGPADGGGLTQPDARSALVGTTWQLVEIASMDDRVYAPDDRTIYTLLLNSDGSMRVRADCNLGNGSWTSASPGKLEFGLIAATQALCPPDSLHDRYMTQFPWIRSYVMKDGHLFLATMADGSIIEFEPVELPVAAMVFGEEVRTTDAGEMQKILLSRLFDRFAEEHGIKVTDAEIDAYVGKMRRSMRAEGLTAEDDLTPEEAVQAEQMRREMARSMIRQWKLNRALYRQYGGRIIFQQLGPEPLDAYRHYLEERKAAGDFTIYEKAFEDEFWQYFVDDSRHDFYELGSEQAERAFATPPWEDTTNDAPLTGRPAVDKVVPSAPENGGPMDWEVSGVATGLRLRAEPSTSAQILATYPPGSILNNLGCLRAESRVWCDVQRFGGGPRGYVAAEFLVPAISPDGAATMGPDDSSQRAGRGEFDATGRIPCAQHAGQPTLLCDFGVARAGGGYATVVVTKPDGTKRAIFFRRGVAISADTSEADGYGEFSVEKDRDLNLIRVGDERYEIPDAVVMGG